MEALLPVVARLRERFGIARMCVVADRGMISAETIAALESRGVDYILGARERGDAEVREIVLADRKPMVPLVIPRARGRETAIKWKRSQNREIDPGDAADLSSIRRRHRRPSVLFVPRPALAQASG